MNFALTPGPWHWDGLNLYPSAPNPAVSTVHTIINAEYTGWGFCGAELKDLNAECDANLRAIAAVPQLMDAAASALVALTPRGPIRNLTAPESIAFFKLRDALAAATGA